MSDKEQEKKLSTRGDGEVKGKQHLPSLYQIGDSVSFSPENGEYAIPAYIRAITFTNSKIRYSLYLIAMKSTIHNVDSVLVTDCLTGDFKKMDFGDDNYS